MLRVILPWSASLTGSTPSAFLLWSSAVSRFFWRTGVQLGYKSVKYLSHIFVTDTVKNIGKGLGGFNPEDGYSWYGGI